MPFLFIILGYFVLAIVIRKVLSSGPKLLFLKTSKPESFRVFISGGRYM